ncbi:GAF and ANTAR domain-containing protein [Rhodococcus triatomae]|uniref:GAF domain-containing protein n=1 Tax=Rhodococcus triatomae TaxID=300028 RepID=A0A1G8QJ42_9NOCA|nr:GAF and ANTAR domain-containing protein [Rhodococcus triatomae]QNG20654.1 GAF and ANTAR domain-containing protein [Rhodococcus triatomae]QNG23428.1 GAF and ANTAR domain-containing protein [Rhodococcus triatomae]SDJ04804.1 GAF domain-containing protein [Rhodococcus triatomae]
MNGEVPDPRQVFTALADIVYRGSSVSEVYTAVCVSATILVPGCDHASLMLHQEAGFATAAASDEVARLVDEYERELGEGPCLDAILDEVPQLDPDLATPTAWPALAARLLADTPVRGVMGFRLLVDDRKVGALNLFSDTPGTFGSEAADAAALLTSFASVAVAAAAHGEQARSLREGLASNREIGKAIGLLMALHHFDDDAAFDLLRRTSQSMNVKIAEVARRVVAQHR